MRTDLDVVGDVLPGISALGLGEACSPHLMLFAVAGLEISSRHHTFVVMVLQVPHVAARHWPADQLGELVHRVEQDEKSLQAPVGIGFEDAPGPGVRLLQVSETLGQCCHPEVVNLILGLAQLLLGLELQRARTGTERVSGQDSRAQQSTVEHRDPMQ